MLFCRMLWFIRLFSFIYWENKYSDYLTKTQKKILFIPLHKMQYVIKKRTVGRRTRRFGEKCSKILLVLTSKQGIINWSRCLDKARHFSTIIYYSKSIVVWNFVTSSDQSNSTIGNSCMHSIGRKSLADWYHPMQLNNWIIIADQLFS